MKLIERIIDEYVIDEYIENYIDYEKIDFICGNIIYFPKDCEIYVIDEIIDDGNIIYYISLRNSIKIDINSIIDDYNLDNLEVPGMINDIVDWFEEKRNGIMIEIKNK